MRHIFISRAWDYLITVTDTTISSPCWSIKKSIIPHHKPIHRKLSDKWLEAESGTYLCSQKINSDCTSDMNLDTRLNPFYFKTTELKIYSKSEIIIDESDETTWLETNHTTLESNGIKVNINLDYAALLTLGEVWLCSFPKNSPVIIKSKENGEIIVCIKPIEESEVMRITFKPNDKERVYVDESRVTNGHWLLNKEVIGKRGLLKSLKPWQSVVNGTYWYKEFQSEFVPSLNQIVPDIKLGYFKLDSFSLSIPKIDVDTLKVQAVEVDGVYKDSEGEVKDIKIGVSPDYVALLSLGEVWVKDKVSPIAIVNDEQVMGVVMPMRL